MHENNAAELASTFMIRHFTFLEILIGWKIDIAAVNKMFVIGLSRNLCGERHVDD